MGLTPACGGVQWDLLHNRAKGYVNTSEPLNYIGLGKYGVYFWFKARKFRLWTSEPKSCSCQAMLGGRWQSFCRRSPSNSTDQCDAGGQRKALDQIFTANTLKWKESEADGANSEQVTMIYSPAHPRSCPELEIRGIKVFSGVNDLFFHIFQRRQICK